MKYSLYNNYVENANSVIVFNSLSMTFLHLNPELWDLMKNHSPQHIKVIHPDFYSALMENSFICDDNMDEYKDAVKLLREINNDMSTYRLIVNPTTNCNFHCWYCYENHNKPNKMKEDTKRNICKHIENVISSPDLHHFQLSFFGGEPMIFYSEIMLPIAKFAKNCANKYCKDYALDVTSNAYLFNTEKFEQLKKLGLKSCQITLDGNKEKHNLTRFLHKGADSYSTIINNIHIAVGLDINIALRINYTKDNLKDIHLILQDFEDLTLEKRKLVTLSMNKVWQETDNNLMEKVSQFIDLSRDFGFTIPDAFGADHVRNPCYADKVNEAVINFDGKVYKCNARDFTDERHEGILNEEGKIEWNELHSKRLKVRNANNLCRECSIFPICGGGCSQVALENANEDYCIGKSSIDDTIRQMFSSKYCIKTEAL